MAEQKTSGSRSEGASEGDAAQLAPPDVLEGLYERYYRRLVGYARREIVKKGIHPAPADGSDVVQDGWKSFLSWVLIASNRERLPMDQDELWRILCTFVMRKVLLRLRLQRRGGGAVVPESALEAGGPPDEEGSGGLFAQLEGDEISPVEAAIIAETIDGLRRAVADDPWARRAVELSLAGETTAGVVAALRGEFGISQASAYRQIDKVKVLLRRFIHDEG